jgi:lipopolysaccharide/colanic/teichoic acid biosynthesis glycosyltransferase
MWPFLAVVASAYAGALAVTRRVLALPRCGRVTGVLFSASLSFALGAILLFFARAYYSRPFLLIAFAAALVWIYAGHRLFFSVNQIRYGFAPGSLIQELRDEWRGNFVEIPSPESGEMFDILVVAPYQDKPLPPEWARYVANVMIHGAPMVHPGTVYEFFAGRLPLKYMEEGPGVYIRPPRGYFLLKRACDWAMLIALLVPAMLCVGAIALAILLTSGRPVFFVQERIGKGGAPFRMMKFRSMTGDGEITDIGRRLRKYRLDELPQIWNVLRGEMSFIGPRPETPELTRLYTERIPFYPYRYSVPPGITGWAQVNFGYASDTSENRVKLSYDLYYVKHASLALDALIILKTVVTMLLGFGAK